MPKGICQSWMCKRIAKWYNPKNKFKYCQDCYDKLGGKIIFDSRNNNYTRLILIPKGGLV